MNSGFIRELYGMIMPCADAANGHAVTATRLMKWKKKSSENIVYQSKKVDSWRG